MITSVLVILISGFFLRKLFVKLRIPGIIGMVLAGALIGMAVHIKSMAAAGGIPIAAGIAAERLCWRQRSYPSSRYLFSALFSWNGHSINFLKFIRNNSGKRVMIGARYPKGGLHE